jgi:multiple sugar transport system ATP-binding protein
MGDENTVYLLFDDWDGDPLVATVSGMRQVDSGESVIAHIPEEAIHLFDGATGRALHNRTLADEEVANVTSR